MASVRSGFLIFRTIPYSTSLTATPQADAPTTVNSDPKEIFQRAFWRRPGDGDKILHAERREWSDADGVSKWQWFLVVEPSPELVKHLREDNAFGLVSGGSLPEIKRPPSWFTPPSTDVDVLQAPHGNLRLIFSKNKNLLHAMDAGGGFQAGAPEPVKAAPQPAAPGGRLPATPPPDPRAR
jgi:hypothetical protein